MNTSTEHKSDRSWKGRNIQTGEDVVTSDAATNQEWRTSEYRYDSKTNSHVCFRDGKEIARWDAKDAGHVDKSTP